MKPLPSPTEVSFLHFVRSEIVKSVRRGQLSRSMVSRDSVSSDFEMYSIPWSVKFSQWDRVNSEIINVNFLDIVWLGISTWIQKSSRSMYGQHYLLPLIWGQWMLNCNNVLSVIWIHSSRSILSSRKQAAAKV